MLYLSQVRQISQGRRMYTRTLDVSYPAAMWPFLLTLLVFAQPTCSAVVLGEPIVGGRLLVASDGYVTAEFLGSDAGYFNSLYLDSPVPGDRKLFDKQSPLNARPLDLGWYDEGTELIFRLDVLNTGNSFFSGDAGRNFDGVAHASAITLFEDDMFVTMVGFEDLAGGGDEDFNDFMFRLTNIVDPVVVPEPSLISLFGISLLGFHFARSQGRRRAP
jgi:hypothetical protein